MALAYYHTEEDKIDALQFCSSQLRSCIASFRAIKKMREEMYERGDIVSDILTDVEAASAGVKTLIDEVADYLDESGSAPIEWDKMAIEVRPNDVLGYKTVAVDATGGTHLDLPAGSTAYTDAGLVASDVIRIYNAEDSANNLVCTISSVEDSGQGLILTAALVTDNTDDETLCVRKIADYTA